MSSVGLAAVALAKWAQKIAFMSSSALTAGIRVMIWQQCTSRYGETGIRFVFRWRDEGRASGFTPASCGATMLRPAFVEGRRLA